MFSHEMYSYTAEELTAFANQVKDQLARRCKLPVLDQYMTATI